VTVVDSTDTIPLEIQFLALTDVMAEALPDTSEKWHAPFKD
jgi:hypothetical protein